MSSVFEKIKEIAKLCEPQAIEMFYEAYCAKCRHCINAPVPGGPPVKTLMFPKTPGAFGPAKCSGGPVESWKDLCGLYPNMSVWEHIAGYLVCKTYYPINPKVEYVGADYIDARIKAALAARPSIAEPTSDEPDWFRADAVYSGRQWHVIVELTAVADIGGVTIRVSTSPEESRRLGKKFAQNWALPERVLTLAVIPDPIRRCIYELCRNLEFAIREDQS